MYFTLTFSAVLAAALTPVTKRVTSRAKSKGPWFSVPLAAIISASLFWSATQLLTVNLAFAGGLAAVSAILATHVVIDLYVRRLLRQLSYAGFVIFLLCSFFVKPMEASGTSGLLVGAFSMAAIAALLVLVSRGALGLGDFHLAPLLGAILGWFSPSAVLLAWMITAIAGALFTTMGLVSKRLSRGSLIPYGPFMIFGTLVAVVAVGIRG